MATALAVKQSVSRMLDGDASIRDIGVFLDTLDGEGRWAELSGLGRDDARSAARSALAQVGLGDRLSASCRGLSHGMARRAGIAGALMGSPDLVLLDWMLPHVSGIEICRQIRARAQRPQFLRQEREAEKAPGVLTCHSFRVFFTFFLFLFHSESPTSTGFK